MPFWRRLNGRLKSTWPSIGRQSVGNLLRVRREPRGRDRHPNGLRLGNPRLRAKPRARSGIAGAARSALHGSPEIAENRAKLLTFPFQIGETRSEEHTSELQSLMRISYDVFCLK